MPALQDLVAAFMRAMTGGDTSQWHAALQMPHYSAFAMPALSMHCGAHVSWVGGKLAEWCADRGVLNSLLLAAHHAPLVST